MKTMENVLKTVTLSKAHWVLMSLRWFVWHGDYYICSVHLVCRDHCVCSIRAFAVIIAFVAIIVLQGLAR